MCKDACVLHKLARVMVQATNGPCTLADAERLGENSTTFSRVVLLHRVALLHIFRLVRKNAGGSRALCSVRCSQLSAGSMRT